MRDSASSYVRDNIACGLDIPQYADRGTKSASDLAMPAPRFFTRREPVGRLASSFVGRVTAILILVAWLASPGWAGGNDPKPGLGPPPRIDLRMQGTRFSGVLEHAPLFQVLERIGQLVPLTLNISANSPNPLISLTFTDTPIAEALDQLLLGQNYALSQLPKTERSIPPTQPILVILLPIIPRTASSPPTNPQAPPKHPADPPSVEEWKQQIANGDTPAIRIAALGRLYRQIPAGDMQPILLAALEDEDPQVRTLTITMLGNSQEPEVIGALVEAARWDHSPEIRIEALKVLAKHATPAGQEALRTALEDPEESVRTQAQQLLDQSKSVLPQ